LTGRPRFRELQRSIICVSAPQRPNDARKNQPRNDGREIFTHGVDETTRENVSVFKKIACDAEKVAQTGAKIDLT
jgi:hypothetical protein